MQDKKLINMQTIYENMLHKSSVFIYEKLQFWCNLQRNKIHGRLWWRQATGVNRLLQRVKAHCLFCLLAAVSVETGFHADVNLYLNRLFACWAINYQCGMHCNNGCRAFEECSNNYYSKNKITKYQQPQRANNL